VAGACAWQWVEAAAAAAAVLTMERNARFYRTLHHSLFAVA